MLPSGIFIKKMPPCRMLETPRKLGSCPKQSKPGRFQASHLEM
jgi:hypothetical protein